MPTSVRYGWKCVCFCCGREKNVAVLRDNHGICASCEREIKQDIKNSTLSECLSCRRLKSPKNGKINSSGDFNCWSCLPDGKCSFCGEEKKLPYVCGDEAEGYYIFCKECSEESEWLEMLEN